MSTPGEDFVEPPISEGDRVLGRIRTAAQDIIDLGSRRHTIDCVANVIITAVADVIVQDRRWYADKHQRQLAHAVSQAVSAERARILNELDERRTNLLAGDDAYDGLLMAARLILARMDRNVFSDNAVRVI